MDKQYDVFISYSRKDYVDEHKNVIPGNEVSAIIEALKNAGISYWFDEEGVYSGNEFAKVIVRSIKASKVFVFLSTANSNLSEWTASEISTAHMLKKKIIPVRVDDSAYHDDVILYISRLSHIDYAENPPKGRKELIRSINSYLEEERLVDAKKAEDEKRRKEEIERQVMQKEEIKRIESEISRLEIQKIEYKKNVFKKEQELKSAEVDLTECEKKIQKLQLKLDKIRQPNTYSNNKKNENSFKKDIVEAKELNTNQENKEKDSCGIRLVSFQGNRYSVIARVAEVFGYGNAMSRLFVDSMPVDLPIHYTYREAKNIVDKLSAYGINAQLKED